MLARVTAIALNTYREAVRARILHGLFGLALATAGYALIVGAYASRSRMRVVSDIGAASISIYAIIVAVVIGATSLYRELELKTIFPILARPIRRSEYLVGKLLGTVLTLAVFVAANAGVLLLALAALSGSSAAAVLAAAIGSAVVLGGVAWKLPRARTYLPVAWAFGVALAGYFLAAGAPDDRRVVAGLACLTLLEVTVIAALATLFSSFSSPFLTAVFTFSVVVVGRSADSLAKLPTRVFGETIHDVGAFLSRVVPNLMLFVPPRPLPRSSRRTPHRTPRRRASACARAGASTRSPRAARRCREPRRAPRP
jgi:ABC-type transport system involved in multi-copper enzyme maturation permease subunit